VRVAQLLRVNYKHHNIVNFCLIFNKNSKWSRFPSSF
jgi:hypothetical protein